MALPIGVEILRLTEQCTMRYMLALKHQWEPFHSKMIDVVDAP